MKWTDPSISLVAAGSSHLAQGVDWIGWNRTILSHLRNHVDYLSLHLDVGNQANNYYEFVASSIDLDNQRILWSSPKPGLRPAGWKTSASAQRKKFPSTSRWV